MIDSTRAGNCQHVFLGLLVKLFIVEYDMNGAYELTAPTWTPLNPLPLIHGMLVVLAGLPQRTQAPLSLDLRASRIDAILVWEVQCTN